ncbi:MAG TPA: hypothetical protein PKN29_14230, partial [Candidatus Ozemobacteraceae bacterium]|nr:hypothetical protein [Candidatus Ozemobacteraceae bacterium]
MKNNRLSVVICLLLIFSSVQLWAGSLDSAYQSYVSAYKKYQNAVSANLSKSEIDAALSEYRSARSAYEAFLNKSSAADTSDQGSDSQISDLDSLSTAVDDSEEAGRSDSERSMATLIAALPAEIKPLVETLKRTSSKTEVTQIVATIEKYLEARPQSNHRALLQYEMASALDRLAIDAKKAEQLFTEVSKNSADKKVAGWGGLALKYLKAK